MMLKKSIKEIAERMLERAHKDILEPQEYSSVEDGEPEYFDVIGQRGYELSQRVGKTLPQDVVVLNKDIKVRIEIEPGLGLTMEGKREAMQQIIQYMLQLNEVGFIPPEALQQVIKRFLETFGYGSTQEFMEAIDENVAGMDDKTLQKMKMAVLEALEEVEEVGPKASQKRITENKMGTLEALQDSGIIDKIQEGNAPPLTKEPSKSISFKDLPPEGKAQLAAQANIQLNSEEIQAQEDADTMKQQLLKVKQSKEGEGNE